MRYEMNFGSLNATAAPRTPGTKFRIAVLGDFSGAANAGRLDTGEALAARKPQRVDVDNLDDVLKRFKLKLHLPVAADDGSVEVAIGEMDDFHPDQLYDDVELFSEFSGLRQRLKNKGTFAAAAKEVQAWAGEIDAEAAYAAPRKSRSADVPNAKLSDFSRLVGAAGPAEREATAADELIKQIVGPHITAAKDPAQDKLVAAVDSALTDAMRRVLHHPEFQAAESLWRAVELLVRRIETGPTMEIVLFDLTAEELAADLSSAESLNDSGLYKLLVEQPASDAAAGPFSVVIANFTFEQSPPHAELLGRIARVAAVMRAPFLAGMSNDALKKLKPDEVHPLVVESWAALRSLPEAAYLGLVAPRFMLRWPYGKKTEPIDPFDFEEFSRREGMRSMLWGNGAFLAGLLLAETCAQQGLKAMKLGSVMSVGDMPYYYYTDEEGDQVALPCTDRLLTEALAAHATSRGLMPIVALKGRAEVRLASFQSAAGKPLLGPWSAEHVSPSTGDAVRGAATVASGTAEPPPAEPAAATSAGEAPAESAPNADAELDALLASLNAPAEAPPAEAAAGEDQLDPELAALLADL